MNKTINNQLNRARRLRPISVLVFSFAGLILCGSLALMLPESVSGPVLNLTDALFTATSAVCVTGLVVFDPGTTLSLTGQIIVLVLIQLGGLGIMTFSTLLMIMMGRKLSFRTHAIIHQAQPVSYQLGLGRTLMQVVAYTLVIETVGFALLAFGFARYMPLEKALWWACFHSISAFCNAGFSLSATSLIPFQTDWLVNGVIMGLIILGGLGFVVLAELADRTGRSLTRREQLRRGLSLHSKIVLTFTAALILSGAAYIFIVESMDSLAAFGWGERLLISLFQSVTARTAGFNTVDMAHLSNASVFMLLGLMFFGASPGSCGGGVKTTTLATLAAMARARIKGETSERLFGRSLPRTTVSKALALLLGSVVVIGLGLALLFSFMPETADRGQFVALVFESFSAFGTVGLSLGATAGLDVPAKLVIISLMFIGRLGPLTMAQFLSANPGPDRFRFAEETYLIG